MEEIVIATGNPHKVRELRAIFSSQGIPVIGLEDLRDQLVAGSGARRFLEPEEHGSTFADNARIKAIAYAQQSGRLCLADDSGLQVDALGGAPGVISSHYATDGVDTGLTREQRDLANNQRLLRELEGVPEGQRTARFVCIMCLAAPGPDRQGRLLAMTLGTMEGRIGLPGAGGVGTGGVFLGPPFVLEDGRTSGELLPEEKNARSHRAAAADKMATEILRLLGPEMND
jgi:XTP/dITP diphosphohydrolase